MGRGLVRSATGAIGTGVLAAGLMACGPSESKQTPAGRDVQDPKPAASASAGTGTAAGVKAVGSVGGEDTPCRLPVSFDLVQDWKPKAVTHAEDDRFASSSSRAG